MSGWDGFINYGRGSIVRPDDTKFGLEVPADTNVVTEMTYPEDHIGSVSPIPEETLEEKSIRIKAVFDGLTPTTKQERYQGKSGEDLIDRWAREETPEVFRIKIMAQIERYSSRYGKKDVTLKEAIKIQDYATRLVEYETKLAEELK